MHVNWAGVLSSSLGHPDNGATRQASVEFESKSTAGPHVQGKGYVHDYRHILPSNSDCNDQSGTEVSNKVQDPPENCVTALTSTVGRRQSCT
jgi:hypothetical protein